jgi:phosphatidylglycerophosphatase A
MNASVRKFILSGFGLGYLRPAPGTWGSLGCVTVIAGVFALSQSQCVVTATAITIAGITTVACIALGKHLVTDFGQKDPGICSLDEWAGQAIALIALPLGNTLQQHAIVLAGAFLAFRLFDIVKPFPCRRLEYLPDGIGVVADDLAAGVYAAVVMQLVVRGILGW